jgi:hypothetical protein
MPDFSLFGASATDVGDNFFSYFNGYGALTSLPEGSFDTSDITTVGNSFFANFNYQGALTSLPEGSFDTSNITSAGDRFFYFFNSNGHLIDLPMSFKRPNVQTILNNRDSFSNAFNSPNYTLNRNANDIISGIDDPPNDRNTFSDNQPGLCNIHKNWKVDYFGCSDTNIQLTVVITTARQTVRLNNYFANAFVVDW